MQKTIVSSRKRPFASFGLVNYAFIPKSGNSSHLEKCHNQNDRFRVENGGHELGK